MAQSSPGSAARPLSPHLQVWRWHITMFCSIANRAAGIALYVGFLILAGWAIALLGGPEAYAAYTRLLASPLGKLVLFGLTVAALYHLAAGVRHLVWDAGKGFSPRTADLTGAACIAFALVGAVLTFVVAFFAGAL
jgi:succinate dehydrogenase / fumarate reductase, cytochrome b subunit